MATVNWNAMEGNECVRTEQTLRLKLFTGSDRDNRHGLSPAMTLLEFYREYFLPAYLKPRGAAAKNVKQYAESLSYWKRFTADPPLEQIDDYTCAEFLTALKTLPGRKKGEPISPNTVRKHCVHVQHVLDTAGPRTRRVKMGQRLLQEVPYLEKPRKRKKRAIDSFTLDELSAILGACDVAKAPLRTGVKPAEWWRSIFVFNYNTGFRIGTLCALRYEWISWQADFNCMAVEIPGYAYKGGDDHIFPVNKHAMAAIESIRTQRALIFPWPHTESWLHANRRRILRAAGLPENRRFGFHGLRKLYGTQISRIDPTAGRLSLGHTNEQTFDDSYAHPKLIAEAADQLPQPKLPPAKPPQP